MTVFYGCGFSLPTKKQWLKISIYHATTLKAPPILTLPVRLLKK